MNKILVCDDEKNITHVIEKLLLHEGYKVRCCYDGKQAIDACLLETFDLIILDIMMPGTDGFIAASEIRKKHKVPIMMLSARSQEYDKIAGFELGIDDYLTKPFSNRELILRVKAIIARTKHYVPGENCIKCQQLRIDLMSRKVKVDDNEVKLSLKEYELLLYLIQNKGIALSREKILNSIWGYDFYGDERTLDTHIKLLRRNLQSAGKFITTIRGIGYRFEN